MARTRKGNGPNKSEQQGDAPGAGHNGGIDTEIAKAFVGRIERLKDDLLSERGGYMARCKSIRANINAVLDEAATEGLPRRELKAVIRARDLERRADAVRDELEGDEPDTFDRIRIALGDYADTPLGAAALAQHQQHATG